MALDVTARRSSAAPEAEALEDDPLRSEATIMTVAPLADSSPRREHSRFAVDLDVTVGSDHNFYAGFAENLSAGGVFIATHKLKPVGSPIELTINLPDDIRLHLLGEVRWIRVFNEHSDTPPGMGVRFAELGDEQTAAIQRFLSRRDPLFFDDED
jgi:uncharacterized protein (TIGR02266 family)